MKSPNPRKIKSVNLADALFNSHPQNGKKEENNFDMSKGEKNIVEIISDVTHTQRPKIITSSYRNGNETKNDMLLIYQRDVYMCTLCGVRKKAFIGRT